MDYGQTPVSGPENFNNPGADEWAKPIEQQKRDPRALGGSAIDINNAVPGTLEERPTSPDFLSPNFAPAPVLGEVTQAMPTGYQELDPNLGATTDNTNPVTTFSALRQRKKLTSADVKAVDFAVNELGKTGGIGIAAFYDAVCTREPSTTPTGNES